MSARWRYILGEALVGLRRNLLMTFAVILSVTVSLTLLGASLLLFGDASTVTVFPASAPLVSTSTV